MSPHDSGRRQAAGGRRDNIKVWRDTARGEIKVSKPVMTAGPLTQIKIRTPGARTPVKIASLKQTHQGRRMGYLRRPFLRHVCFERYTGDAFERASPYDRGCACSREGRIQLRSIVSSFRGAYRSSSFLIQLYRDRRSRRAFDLGVFPQPCPRTEIGQIRTTGLKL